MAAGGRPRRHGLARHRAHTHARQRWSSSGTAGPAAPASNAGPGEKEEAALLPCPAAAARSRAGGEPRGGGAARARIWVAWTRAPPSSRLRVGSCRAAPLSLRGRQSPPAPADPAIKVPPPPDWPLSPLLSSQTANHSLPFRYRTVPLWLPHLFDWPVVPNKQPIATGLSSTDPLPAGFPISPLAALPITPFPASQSPPVYQAQTHSTLISPPSDWPLSLMSPTKQPITA